VPIILSRYPVAYHPTPKVACSSIKLALYELEHGRQFELSRDENGTFIYIHDSWRTEYFSPISVQDSYYKFAVVRHPIERFLSAFANRVVYFKELDEKHLHGLKGELEGLKPSPSLSEFISELHSYRRASPSIRHHTDPQSLFIGNNLAYYDRIFCFKELGEIANSLKDAVGAQITLPHEQTGGPKLSMTELSKKQLERLSDFYAEDYLLLADFYQAG